MMNDLTDILINIIPSFIPLVLIIFLISVIHSLLRDKPFVSFSDVNLVSKLDEIVSWRNWLFSYGYYTSYLNLNDKYRIDYHLDTMMFDVSYYELISRSSGLVIYKSISTGFDKFLTKEDKKKLSNEIDEIYLLLKEKYYSKRESIRLDINK